MKIRTKVIGMGLMLVVVTALSIVGIAIDQVHILDVAIHGELERFIRSETQKVAENVYLMCRSVQQQQDEELERNLQVAARLLRDGGGLSFSREEVLWQAVNQFDHSRKAVRLPMVSVGGSWLGMDPDPNRRMPVVDTVQNLLGVTCTLFQRINEQGDMLRVATTILDNDGRRALGSYIPHRNPDGRFNPVIDALLRGQPYTGSSFVVNDWYVTRYEPLFDPTGKKLVGALFVGYLQKSLAGLRSAIQDISVGRTGYVSILGSQGGQRGKLLIAPRKEQSQEPGIAATDRQSLLITQRLLQKASRMVRGGGSGKIPVTFEHFVERDTGNGKFRDKLVAVTYFEPWDWVIVAGAYKDDYGDIQKGFDASLSRATFLIFLVALGIVLFSLLAGFYLSRGIVRPLEKAILLFDCIGKGRLDHHLKLDRKDEIGQLAKAFNRMIDNLREVTASRNELNREIIERSRVEMELRATSAQRRELETIVNHSPAMALLWRLGETWTLEFVSDNISQFGYKAQDFVSGAVPMTDLVPADDLDRLAAGLDACIKQGQEDRFSMECRVIKHSGEICWVDARLWLRRDENGTVTHLQGVLLDVSDRKKVEEQVRMLAFYDALTGLPNRALFTNRLEQSLAQATRDGRLLALMYLDLDHFKAINDTFGHAAGDTVLQSSAQRINSCLRRNDTVARLGGDELVVLLPGLDGPEQAETVAQKIIKMMSAPFQLESFQVSVTPSIGIVLFPEHGNVMGELLKRADIALYAAKEGGRNRYALFCPEMEQASKIVGVRLHGRAARPLEPTQSNGPAEGNV
ncbi:Cache 3/Cache 2 fusion domain-containing protein [Syntrophotalea acetylenica]|uniref:Cache 3/Cache 2 fusion domain-containing protein n=1 Tax=Syntrophotalea acetylenica TaxID=29542 RepID=UPI002A35DC09|nr:Cache 3/Cache 2 fusion domain-containing protein [Syntrophotalea acetylenica]MDY0261564.1 Cache 3/Cache 2 fusion domain-containing protein [Syntrophotalea acetylenica]